MQIRGLGIGSIDTVAQTIQKVEGYYPGTLAYTNNNPGNLRFANQPGATPGVGGFAAFPDYNTGYQALLNQINLDAGRGLTIAQFTAKYAPASDGNNPGSYAQTIASASGLSVDDLLSSAIGMNTGGGTGTEVTDPYQWLDYGVNTDTPVESSLMDFEFLPWLIGGVALVSFLVWAHDR